MSEPTPVLKALKEELLKQNGTAAVGDEMDRLRRIVESQQRRARRLTQWTVGVWATWFVLITLAVGLPFLSYARLERTGAPLPRPSHDPATQASTPTPPSFPRARPSPGPVAALVGVLAFGFMFAAPFVGIILTVMMILARRTAGMSEIRALLASIDVQLRLLAMARQDPVPPPAGKT